MFRMASTSAFKMQIKIEVVSERSAFWDDIIGQTLIHFINKTMAGGLLFWREAWVNLDSSR